MNKLSTKLVEVEKLKVKFDNVKTQPESQIQIRLGNVCFSVMRNIVSYYFKYCFTIIIKISKLFSPTVKFKLMLTKLRYSTVNNNNFQKVNKLKE